MQTTAGVITTAMFHVLNNPDIHEKVYQELKQAFPDKTQEMPFADIEALPYLVRHWPHSFLFLPNNYSRQPSSAKLSVSVIPRPVAFLVQFPRVESPIKITISPKVLSSVFQHTPSIVMRVFSRIRASSIRIGFWGRKG